MYKREAPREDSGAAGLLKTEGINCRGYGIIPKAVMIDPDLSLYAKAIYAYLCSLAGNGTTAFPSRATILARLQLSKDGYYKNLNQLLEHGYLRTHRGDKFPFKSTFTIVANPKKLDTSTDEKYANPYASRLTTTGVKKYGFGFIPRIVMEDSRLSLQAKTIYAYFCSFAGAGSVVFPPLKANLHHLNVVKNTYYKHFSQLVELNYLTSNQRRVNGKYTVCDYILVEMPWVKAAGNSDESMVNLQDNTPVVNTQDIDTITMVNSQDNESNRIDTPSVPVVNLQDNKTNRIDMPSASVVNPQDNETLPMVNTQDTTSNNSFTSINDISILSAPPYNYGPSRNELMDNISQLTHTIKTNVEYDVYQSYDCPEKSYLDSMIDIMVDALITPGPVRIGKKEIPHALVELKLMSLNSSHIEYVCECIQKISNIRDLRSYLLTALYRAPDTIDEYYERMVREEQL